MKRFWLVLPFIWIFTVAAAEQQDPNGHLAVKQADRTLLFRCEGVIGSAEITVTDVGSLKNAPVLKQKLDALDDCTQATWTTNEIGSRQGSTLVMVNPGRLGLDSQLSAFLVSDGSVSFAGYIPASAERIDHSNEYRSYSSDSDSVWQRTDSLMNGRFVISREKQMMQTGFVCIGNTGAVLKNATCRTKRIRASPEKPICIEYRDHVGKLASINACAELMTPWANE